MGPLAARRSGSLDSATRMVSAASSCENGSLAFGFSARVSRRSWNSGNFCSALARGVAAIQMEQRDHQAKGDGDGDGEKQKNAGRRQAGRREGVTVDDPDEQNRDHQGGNRDQGSSLGQRQKTQALFQPLKITIQLVESVQATSFSTERYRLASTDSIIAVIRTSSKA